LFFVLAIFLHQPRWIAARRASPTVRRGSASSSVSRGRGWRCRVSRRASGEAPRGRIARAHAPFSRQFRPDELLHEPFVLRDGARLASAGAVLAHILIGEIVHRRACGHAGALVGRIRTERHGAEEAGGFLARVVERKRPVAADREPPAALLARAILDDEGLHSAGLYPQPEAGEGGIPQEEIGACRRRVIADSEAVAGDGVDCSAAPGPAGGSASSADAGSGSRAIRRG
jgi:hypothetical protein